MSTVSALLIYAADGREAAARIAEVNFMGDSLHLHFYIFRICMHTKVGCPRHYSLMGVRNSTWYVVLTTHS